MLKPMLHAAARRFPGLAASLRPVTRPLIRLATSNKSGWIRTLLVQHSRPARWLFELRGPARRLKKAATQDGLPGIGKMAAGQQIIMLLVANIWVDPRVEREARALAAAGYHVDVICPDMSQPPGSRPAPDWGAGVIITLLEPDAADFCADRPGFMAGAIFDAAMAAAGGKVPLAFHGHDLNTCLAALAAARMTGAHLVADFHEWTSENVHWNSAANAWTPYAPQWKAELQMLETRLMREASAVITVSEAIVGALAKELGNGRKATLIRNIPSLSAHPTKTYAPLKQQLGLPENQFVLLWQGGTGATRLIEPIIEALAFAPKCTFVIRGPSLDMFGKDYQAIADRIGAGDRLILQDSVPSSDVVAAARGADAGIWTLPALCRNFTNALPNKIFEYIASNLPTLVADYPEARRMVETHQVGLTFNPYDPQSIAAAINRLIDDPAFARACRDNTVTALTTLDANGEWQKLVALYDALPRSDAPPST
ncbi:MAG: glycosyltransferase [Beijerinckiaceae bacterium]